MEHFDRYYLYDDGDGNKFKLKKSICKNHNIKLILSKSNAEKEFLKNSLKFLTIDNENTEFSDGFTGLHTESYASILKGGGFGLADVKTAIQIVHYICNAKLSN